MTTVAEISSAVKRLPKRELARFRKWFVEYGAAIWDRELEADIAAARLDALVREAKRDKRTGRRKELEAPRHSSILALLQRCSRREPFV